MDEVRVLRADRSQTSFELFDPDQLIPAEHAARQVVAFVEQLRQRGALAPLYEQIRARGSVPGRPAIAPELLLSLWLQATLEGVGSARELDRLSRLHHAYRWICGGVAVNYHTLADFRTEAGAVVNELLAQSVAVLVGHGAVRLDGVLLDGLKVRALAAEGSRLERERIEQLLAEARALVARLAEEVTADPGAVTRRRQAAQARAARERAERLQAALSEFAALEAVQAKRVKAGKAAPPDQGGPAVKVSVTDPEARTLKHPGGPRRLGYNCQVAVDPESRLILAVAATTAQNDKTLAEPMVIRLAERYGAPPQALITDSGFVEAKQIGRLEAAGTACWMPLPKGRDGGPAKTPRRSKDAGVLAWRERMQGPAAAAMMRLRKLIELVNAHLRGQGLTRLSVVGQVKAEAVLALHALAYNAGRFVARARLRPT
jgi:transposase